MQEQKRIRFSYMVRAGLHVATSIALDVLRRESKKNTWVSAGPLIPQLPPMIISVSEMDTTSPIFAFEGGTVVQTFLHEVGQYQPTWQESRSQEWVVLSAGVRAGHGKDKEHELWDAARLQELKSSSMGWYRPDVREDVCDQVVVTYLDGHYYVRWDQDNSLYLGTKEHEVKFSHLVPGDQTRARDEAREWLFQHLLARQGWEKLARSTADYDK